jgi:hypothetical protein
MARTKRARKKGTSKRKTTKKRTSARRTSTKRKPVRRTTRSTARRSTARRTARRKSAAKRSRVTRKQKTILLVAAAVAAALILIALLQNPTRTYVQKTYYAGEIASNKVEGKVTSAAIGALGRGAIYVQSYNTGKTYKFYTGVRTHYNIRGRYPAAGDTARVSYINDQGYLKATYIRIR